MDIDNNDLSYLLKCLKQSNEKETKIKGKITLQKTEISKTENMIKEFQDCLNKQNEFLLQFCLNLEKEVNQKNQLIKAIKQLGNENDSVCLTENSESSSNLSNNDKDKMKLSVINNMQDLPLNEMQISTEMEHRGSNVAKKRKLDESIDNNLNSVNNKSTEISQKEIIESLKPGNNQVVQEKEALQTDSDKLITRIQLNESTLCTPETMNEIMTKNQLLITKEKENADEIKALKNALIGERQQHNKLRIYYKIPILPPIDFTHKEMFPKRVEENVNPSVKDIFPKRVEVNANPSVKEMFPKRVEVNANPTVNVPRKKKKKPRIRLRRRMREEARAQEQLRKSQQNPPVDTDVIILD